MPRTFRATGPFAPAHALRGSGLPGAAFRRAVASDIECVPKARGAVPPSYGQDSVYAHGGLCPGFSCWEIIPAPWMGPDFLTAQDRASRPVMSRSGRKNIPRGGPPPPGLAGIRIPKPITRGHGEGHATTAAMMGVEGSAALGESRKSGCRSPRSRLLPWERVYWAA